MKAVCLLTALRTVNRVVGSATIPHSHKEHTTMARILAIDLGKFKSVTCLLDTATNDTGVWAMSTDRLYLHTVLKRYKPDRDVVPLRPARRFPWHVVRNANGGQPKDGLRRQRNRSRQRALAHRNRSSPTPGKSKTHALRSQCIKSCLRPAKVSPQGPFSTAFHARQTAADRGAGPSSPDRG